MLHTFRMSQIVVVSATLLLIFILVLTADYHFAHGQEVVGDFELLGVHPIAGSEAEKNPEVVNDFNARFGVGVYVSIRDLFPWKGKLYPSYRGIYKEDDVWTPMRQFAYDTMREEFVEEFSWPGIVAEPFRVIDGVLYALAETSSHTQEENPPQTTYAELRDDNWTIWSSDDKLDSKWTVAHTYDLAQARGDLWLATQDLIQQTDSCVIYRSTDDGKTWKRSLEIPARPESVAQGGTFAELSRCYFVGVLNDHVYVQATDYNNGIHGHSMVFDGEEWTEGPNLFAPLEEGDYGLGSSVETFFGNMMYLHGFTYTHKMSDGSTLYAFDGASASIRATDAIDFFVGYDTLYLLATSSIRATKDLETWETLTSNIPDTALSIAVMDDRIYLGATDAKLYRSTFSLGGDGTTDDSDDTVGEEELDTTDTDDQRNDQTTCHLITPGGNVLSGFGAPYNTLSSSQELLISATCDPADGGAEITVGSGQENQYIYTGAYVWDGSQWQPHELTGPEQAGESWLIGTATTGLANVSSAESTFFVSFLCTNLGTADDPAWKCGCRTEACDPNADPKTGGLWQLQAVSLPEK